MGPVPGGMYGKATRFPLPLGEGQGEGSPGRAEYIRVWRLRILSLGMDSWGNRGMRSSN